MSKSPPFALVIGLDRSDTQADLHLIDTPIGSTPNLRIPEVIH